jgi:xanthine dehydrogenase accessory factor
VTPALLERLLAARRDGRAVALATAIPGGAQTLIEGAEIDGELRLAGADLAAAQAAIGDDQSRLIETSLGQVFVEVWNPPLRLMLIGAVHIGQALAPMAALAGYRVTVIDPRQAFAAEARFPGVELVADWPDDALSRLKPDKRSAIVTLTHDPKIDDPALSTALRSDAFYIGALGSRRTHAKRIERLTAAGFAADAVARIRGPVGLPLGALTPAEIAISILAEMIAVLRRTALGAGTP